MSTENQQAEAKVRAYSGYKYGERPYSFQWQGKEYEVEKVEREWKELGKRCFLVLTKEAKLFKLFYYEQRDVWEALQLEKGQ